MSNYIQTRTQLRGERMVEALKKRNIEACYVATKEEALTQALRWIPEGSSVGWGGSMTIDEIGLKDAIRQGNYVALDRDVAPTPEEKDQIMHDILSADYFLTSANAIAEDGTMVNIDGVSNRLAAMCYGPRHVLYIIGMNKAVSSPEDAYQRARTEAAPINAMRFDLNTPCRNTGCCYDCQSPDTICCQILITRHSRIPGRAKVILVEESLGF